MNFESLKNHKYIKLIEFALNNQKFSRQKACKATGLTEKEFDFLRRDIFVLSEAQSAHENLDIDQEWTLSNQAFFNYLQYQEFHHSVNTSRKAHWTAIVAIIISAFIGLVSIFATLCGA